MTNGKISTHHFSAALWPDLVTVLGADGGSDGCWCMSARSLDEVKGEVAKAKLKELVEAGKVSGVLAYDKERPIGWCSYGPRQSFPQLDKHPDFATSDAATTYSISCFYIHPDYRGQGVSKALLSAVLESLKEGLATTLEAYPLKPEINDNETVVDWAFHGPYRLYESHGFTPTNECKGRLQCVRKLISVEHAISDADMDHLTQKLLALGASDIVFGQRDLLKHLKGTYELLRSWGHSAAICAAGLYHNVYLTYIFNHHDPDNTNRTAIRNIIGFEAEELAYLYCVIDRRKFIKNAPSNRARIVHDSFTNSDLSLSDQVFQTLVELIWANAFEQLLQPEAAEDDKQVEKAVFSATKHLVSNGARRSFDRLYQ